MNKYSQCLELDAGWLPRKIISSNRAFVIRYKGNCDIVEEHPERFGLVDPTIEIFKPSIIKCHSYRHTPYQKVSLSRENIFRRDDHTCVYCGDTNKRTLTVDHVIPQSKGGPNTWDNLVTACKRCNGEKSDLTLEEYGKEIPKPQRPHSLMLLKKVGHIPDEWKPFLFF